MREWLIQLEGSDSDIEFLGRFLEGSPYEVVDGPIGKALTLPGLPPDADGEAVQAAANALVDVVNGATRLYNDTFGGVRFVKVTRLGEDGKWHGFGYLTLRPRSTEWTVFPEKDETLVHWISTGMSDDAALRALGLYGSLEPSWKNLYLVFEVVMDDVGGQGQLESKSWVPRSQIRRFKGTANSYHAIGREARHAKMTFKPPSKPMSLKDAREFVRTILTKWLDWRESQSG